MEWCYYIEPQESVGGLCNLTVSFYDIIWL